MCALFTVVHVSMCICTCYVRERVCVSVCLYVCVHAFKNL